MSPEVAAILAAGIGALAIVAFATFAILGRFAHHGFIAWLEQRERERLSALDKAELLKKFEQVDGKLLELKNAPLRGR